MKIIPLDGPEVSFVRGKAGALAIFLGSPSRLLLLRQPPRHRPPAKATPNLLLAKGSVAREKVAS